MKVILLQEVDNLGAAGTVVTVKDGYGRNFLIPRGLARIATSGQLRAVQEEARQKSRKLAAIASQAQRVASELENLDLVIYAKAGSEGRLFGSVTSSDLAEVLARKGFQIDRRKIELDEDIRSTGVFSASVRLHPEVVGRFKVKVVAEGSEA